VIPYIHLGPLTLGTFGIMMAAAFLSVLPVLRRDAERRGLRLDPTNIVVVAAFCGIAGAKLYFAFEHWSELLAEPVDVLFSPYGFTWFGGLLGALLGLWVLARRTRMTFVAMLDLCAPAAALGYAIGRIGCLVSGDGDYGIPTDLPWGMSFPNGLVPTTARVHPTPIYEMLASLGIAWFLWKRGVRPAGDCVGWYLMLSGVARFLVEFIRLNDRVLWGLTNAQLASAASVVVGAVLVARAARFPVAAQTRQK
jgi:phosphatidylglycerol:prolipoprotein diacylglycerol transferase